MSLYTRTGDDGTTGLCGGGRIEKDSQRIHAVGDVDELNAALGAVGDENLEPLQALCYLVAVSSHHNFTLHEQFVAEQSEASQHYIVTASVHQKHLFY